ncbi:MAG: nucleotide pyrophosphohydrolase [Muribaculaceae bacterium]|nr:nucleotide pyrophosphohydrolase [Muribaculaceae bacterium]
MTIRELQHIVDTWISGTGGGYFSELTNAAILAEETGEVARVMARLFGDQRPKPGDKCTLPQLADELADTLWVVTAIANQTGIDLTEALQRNLDKKNRRDSDRFTDNHQ